MQINGGDRPAHRFAGPARYLLGGLATLAILAVAAAAVIMLGAYDVAATRPHNAITHWILSTTMRSSVSNRATQSGKPMPVTEELAVRGFADFDEMCVTCHGAPGKERSEIGKGLNPTPPDLMIAARRWSDTELFWIIKNGIRMTGMPAFGLTHDDERIWAIATVVRHLPDMTAERYAERTRSRDQSSDNKQPAETAKDLQHHH